MDYLKDINIDDFNIKFKEKSIILTSNLRVYILIFKMIK